MSRSLAIFVSVLCASLLVASCSPDLPKGWTVQKQCSKNNCWSVGATPDHGKWLGFTIGMSHDEALRALCNAVLKGDIERDGAPVRAKDTKCEADVKDPDWDIWGLKAHGFRCGLMGSQTIYFEFSDKELRLTRIAAYCPTLDL